MRGTETSLVDVTEIARMLGVSRQNATELVDFASDFPASRAECEERPVWARRQVEIWLAAHPRREAAWRRPWSSRPGRPTARVFAILQLAVKESQELNQGWVGDEHLLLALLQPDCPGAAREALESFGFTLEGARRAVIESVDESCSSASEWKPLLRRTQYVLERATLKAVELRDEQVSGEHALLALLEASDDGRAPVLLADEGIDPLAVARHVIALTDRRVTGSDAIEGTATASSEVDAAGVARILGISRKRVAELAASAPDFPSSQLGRRGYRLWFQPAVESWAVAHPDRGPERRKLRPPAPGTVGDDTEQILEIAMAEARALHHPLVLPDHLFLALLHPDCPGEARTTLESLGLTLEEVRKINSESMGDSCERGEHELAIPPATHLLLERATLKALELEDEEVTDTHIMLALTDHWDGSLPLGWARPEIHFTTFHDHLMAETDGMLPA